LLYRMADSSQSWRGSFVPRQPSIQEYGFEINTQPTSARFREHQQYGGNSNSSMTVDAVPAVGDMDLGHDDTMSVTSNTDYSNTAANRRGHASRHSEASHFDQNDEFVGDDDVHADPRGGIRRDTMEEDDEDEDFPPPSSAAHHHHPYGGTHESSSSRKARSGAQSLSSATVVSSVPIKQTAAIPIVGRASGGGGGGGGAVASTGSGKKQKVCLFCGTSDTPMWRRGPDGKGTLCNACGVSEREKREERREKR
jgi:hypothetical protein